MRKVHVLSQVDEERCIGDKICENACPTGAIKVTKKKASVDEKKCAACLKCLDVCGEGAIRIVPRAQPLILGANPEEVDQTALRELCHKAHLDPEKPICVCTLTQAKEVAAAILKGAQSPEEVTLMTGIRTSCGMWCMAPVLRLLRAHGVDMTPPEGFRWYDAEPTLWDIPAEVARKYPEYCLEEDKQLFDEGILDNIVGG